MCPFNVPLRVNNESSRSVVEALLDNVLPLGRVEIVRGQGLREILQTIVIQVVKDAKPLEYFHTLFHHHALPSLTTVLAMTPNLNQNMSPPLHYHGKAEGHGSAKFIFRASWHYLRYFKLRGI